MYWEQFTDFAFSKLEISNISLKKATKKAKQRKPFFKQTALHTPLPREGIRQ